MKNKDKIILDAACGNRMFWINKKHPNTIYIDNRRRSKGLIDVRPNFDIQPDEIGDFRNLKYKNNSFKLVVWDPPHIIRKTPELGWPTKKYGNLYPDTWKQDLQKGFSECWRVLEDYGILIFKWSESDIKKKEVLDLFPETPLFGHPTNSRSTTIWFCFMKIPQLFDKE